MVVEITAFDLARLGHAHSLLNRADKERQAPNHEDGHDESRSRPYPWRAIITVPAIEKVTHHRSLLTIADGNSGFAIIVRQLRHDEEAFAAADIATRRRRLQATAAILATGAAFFNVSFGAIPAIDAIFSHLIAPY
jgi:hypothetical protein